MKFLFNHFKINSNNQNCIQMHTKNNPIRFHIIDVCIFDLFDFYKSNTSQVTPFIISMAKRGGHRNDFLFKFIKDGSGDFYLVSFNESEMISQRVITLHEKDRVKNLSSNLINDIFTEKVKSARNFERHKEIKADLFFKKQFSLISLLPDEKERSKATSKLIDDWINGNLLGINV